MISSLNIFLLIILLSALIITSRYFYKLRDKEHKLEILEIKVKAVQRKTTDEKLQLSEIQKRLEEQKNPLEKKWEEIQAGEKILETKAIKLQQDRELLEKQKYELDHLRIELEENQRRIQAVNQQLKKKWESERQEIEIKKNELKSIIKQINGEKSKLDIQQNQVKKEQQYLVDEKRKILKKTNEYEILKIYFENQRKEVLEEKLKIQKEEAKIFDEKKKLEKEKEDNYLLGKEINKKTEVLRNQEKDLNRKEELLEKNRERLEQNTKELEQAKLEFENLLRRITVSTLHQIKQAREKSNNNAEKTNIERIHNQSALLLLESHCWKKDQKWTFGLKIVNDSYEKNSFQIFQDDDNLSKTELDENIWILKSFSPVKICWHRGEELVEKVFKLSPDNFESPLLFKLQIPDYGRLMKYLSHGSYLIVVPEDWQSEGFQSCKALGETEFISIDGYKAYNFNLSEKDNSLIVFRKPDAKALCIAQQQIRFILSEANCIEKNGQNESLFGVRLPKVIDRENSWNEIGTIIVSDRERKYQKLQRSPFPAVGSAELDLNLIENINETIVNRPTTSNLVIDIYDHFQTLLESIGFKYIDGLEKIDISEHSMLPESTGHNTVQIYFRHDSNCEIQALSKDAAKIHLAPVDNGTRAQIFPAPLADTTNWLIKDSHGREATVKIKLNRIWWQLIIGPEFPQKNNAQDVPLKLSLKNLQTIIGGGIYIWLPEQLVKNHILVGFHKESAKAYAQSADESGIFIQFKELFNQNNFVNVEDISQLRMWEDVKTDKYAVLLDLNADHFICKAKNCNFKTSNKNEMKMHIKEAHLVDLTEKLSYQEIRLKYDRELPIEIYQCGYCNAYICAPPNSENPVTSIIDHIKQCPSANSANGNSFLSFRIVNNLNELKELVIPELPVVSKCILCKQYFKNPGENELLNHFIQFHEEDLMAESTKVALKLN